MRAESHVLPKSEISSAGVLFFFLRGTKFTGAPPPPKEGEEEEEEALYNIRLHLLSTIPRKNCSFAMGVWEYKSFANSLHFF